MNIVDEPPQLICPPRADERTNMPSYNSCLTDVDSLYQVWCQYISDHEDFSTNDSMKAWQEASDLEEVAKQMDEVVRIANIMMEQAWNAVR